MPSPLRRLGVYLELVYTFPATILAGAGGGYLLDRWLGIAPWGILAGFLLGLGGAFVYLIKMLNMLKRGPGDDGRGGS